LPSAPCLKIPRTMGEKTIILAKQLGIFSKELKIEQRDNYLYIPLSREPTTTELKTIEESVTKTEVCIYDFPTKIPRPRTFVDLLAEELPPHLVASLPHAADFIGDIAVIEIPSELEGYKQKIGKTIMATNKHVRTVLAKASAVKGTFRTRDFEVIAGEPKTSTVHREYGCMLHVDLSKAYFSPRLSREHARVARLVEEGETVIDMFAGVGSFAIQIAKWHEKVRVYAVDVNPDAIKLLNKNIAANRVADKVTSILGDARQVVHDRLTGTVDRVVMNLPERAVEYVDVACEALKPVGGIMHYYAFLNASDPLSAVEVRLVEAVEKAHRNVAEVLVSRAVRETAPYTWQVVVDAQIK
jgi:tRNA (guanine37-N1)-methyltransferase